jgi:predicted phosphoribosyltransferase
MTLFADRYDAGRALAQRVVEAGLADPLVLALPRGGVPVGYEVARALGAELDVMVARKIGLPWRPEMGVGAIAGDGPPVFDPGLLRLAGLRPEDLDSVVERERAELRRRRERYRGNRPMPRIEGRSVVVVDDGLATGVTARAALGALREERPGWLVFAAPVCAAEPARAMERRADAVICVHRLEDFVAVGRWYDDFSQVSDETVVTLLRQAREPQADTHPADADDELARRRSARSREG